MNRYYRDLIASPRVTQRTRDVLLKREEPRPPFHQPKTLTEAEFTTLRSVTTRVILQDEKSGRPAVDIAGRLEEILTTRKGDGWRYATLPEDPEACRSGLRLLNEFAEKLKGQSFDRLKPEFQDALLEGIASGRISSAKLDLQRWFEDLRATATQIYVSHPETLARMRYSGIADDPNGFVQLGIGNLEEWEPR